MAATFRFFFILFIVQTISGQVYDKNGKKDIYPWCIVAYDSVQRSFDDRIGILKELGFIKYAYDWREKHLSETEEELRLAIDSDIEIIGLWLWLNAKRDTIGQLSAALYNHSGWFSDPFNQLRIIKALPQHKLQIVFNFHHTHKHIQKLPDIAKALTPYLCAVNLNGMETSGPKILPLGSGRYEKQMVTAFTNMGFNGPWGVMGHVENEDVKVVLQKNLNGFSALFEKD